MDYLPFAAMVVVIAAGLAGLAARLLLPARTRDAGTVVAILMAAAITFVTDLPGPLHARLFGPAVSGAVPEASARASLLDWFLGGMSDARDNQRIDEIKAEIRQQNLDWLFYGDADIDSFARQAVAEAGGDAARLADAIGRLARDRGMARMRVLRQARLATVTDVINGGIESLRYFIDNGQFGNCRTFLLGGYNFPGIDRQVMLRLTGRLGAAVESGQRGEKDWVEVSEVEMDRYTKDVVRQLLDAGYTQTQLGAMARLDTTDPAEMESNCRISHDYFDLMVREFPPEVAATMYVSAL